MTLRDNLKLVLAITCLALAANGCKGDASDEPGGSAGMSSGTAGAGAGAGTSGGGAGSGSNAGEGAAGQVGGSGAGSQAQAGTGAAGTQAGGGGGAEKICDGYFTVTTASDLAAIADCTNITRGLNIIAAEQTSISLSLLEKVAGLGFADNDVLQTVSLPALTDAFSIDLTNNGSITVLELPLVQDLPGGLSAQNNAALTTFSFPGLITSGGNGVIVKQNPVLQHIGLDALVDVQSDFLVHENMVLSELIAPSLNIVVAGFAIQNNPKFPACRAQEILAQLDGYVVNGIWPAVAGNDEAASCE